MNKTIIKKLILLGVLAFVFSFTNTVYAFSDVSGFSDPNPPYVSTPISSGLPLNLYSNNIVNNANNTNTTTTVNNANQNTVVSSTTTPNNKVAVMTKKKTTTVVSTPVATQTVDAPLSTPIDNNGLSANSYSAWSWFGAPGFLPNTVFEWILTFILLLILILLIRQFRPAHVHEAHPTAAVHH